MTTFSSSWRGLPRPALLGLFLFFCAGFADGALVPFFPLWASREAGIQSARSACCSVAMRAES